MYLILGLAMFYAWGHATYIIFKKIVGLTDYERVVSVVAFIGFILYLMGTLME